MTESELIVTSNFTVTAPDTDILARMRMGALMNYLVQAAIESADKLGFGYEHLSRENLFWVLSSLTLHLEKPLKWYDSFEVETWPKDVHKVFYLRDFLIRDARGEVVGRATSGWLAIDFDTHRPIKYEGEGAKIFQLLRGKSALESLPEKLKPLEADDFVEVPTTFFDIDLNRHITSSRYIDKMIDLIPLDYLMHHYPKSLSINYLKETLPGEVLRIKKQVDGDLFTFEGFNLQQEMVSFRGKIGF